MPSPRWFVYIVRCRDGSLYTGTARDIAARLALHDAGKGAKYTASRGPVKLLWQEGPMTVSRALRREHQIKQLTRTQKLALIGGEFVLKLPRRRPKGQRTLSEKVGALVHKRPVYSDRNGKGA